MGISLLDPTDRSFGFDINYWHWRAIVEAVRSLRVLPEERVDALHEAFVGELTESEARAVAAALRERLLPTLGEEERLLLSGERTGEPDDGTLYRGEEQHRNYSTNRAVLERFAAYCERCRGFEVL